MKRPCQTTPAHRRSDLDEALEAMNAGDLREVVREVLRELDDRARRRYDGHAAALVAACLVCDHSPETLRWAGSVRTEYRRFPALCAELARLLGPA